MLEIVIGLAVFLVVIAVPWLRRAALSLLGLLAVIAAGSAVFAVIVWAIYESKPWLTPDLPEPPVARQISPVEEQVLNDKESTNADSTSPPTEEEAQRLIELQLREEERLRIAENATRARVVLDEDKKLVEQAAAHPLLAGVGTAFGDIVAIRIPAWRDEDVAADQQRLIRAWLQSIGLSLAETEKIQTAKAWGSLYDMWVASNPGVAPRSPPAVASEVASTSTAPDSPPQLETSAQEEPPSAPEPFPPSEAVPKAPPAVRKARPRRNVVRAAPRRQEVPPAPPRRRPPRASKTGPFGY